MPAGLVFAYTNPASPEREAEFNAWYDGPHAEDLLVPGVKRMVRYKVAANPPPGAQPQPNRYLAIYELDDIATVFPRLMEAAAKASHSDAVQKDGQAFVLWEHVATIENED